MRVNSIFIVVLLVIVGCAPQATPEPTIEPTVSPYAEIDNICLVTNIGSVDDRTFNQYAYQGMLDVAEEFSEVTTSFVETLDESEYNANIQECVDNEADIIVTVGFQLQESTLEAAIANPDVYFIGVDQDVEGFEESPENYIGIQAREDQAGFLVGIIAATVANDLGEDVIAGVYGLPVPAVVRFRNGYEQGALYINPDWEIGVNILGDYTDSFIDPEQGIDLAQRFIDEGAAVIFGAGGLTGSSGILHAAAQGIYAIGVDQDEYFTTFDSGEVEGAEFLMTSAIKRVDRGVIDVASILFSGRIADFPGGENYVLSVSNNGIGFAPMHDADITQDAFDVANEAYLMIVNGELSTGVDPVTGELLPEVTAEPESTDESE